MAQPVRARAAMRLPGAGPARRRLSIPEPLRRFSTAGPFDRLSRARPFGPTGRAGPASHLVRIAGLVLVLVAAVVLAAGLAPREQGASGTTVSPPPIAAAGASIATGPDESAPPASTSPSASPAATASPTGLAGAAPTTAAGFNVRKTVVSIRFPLKATARYSYEDDFLVRRVGTPYAYNHARATSGGALQRAHDGIDVYVPLGTPLLSPFDGVVIDPSTRWKPWIRSRYGNVAVVVSSEPLSRGYVAILAHLSTIAVRPGARVQRGQVLGRTGRTGNAESTRPHVHFELRAPFLVRVRIGTLVRRVDAFDPYASLVAADPRRRTGPAAP
jgi:murein DD-endopeptidase MepM/ murein hydrolase activator NlpD